jgi:hypothetical protein
MKDGFERRALLLHLGEVMQTVACLLQRQDAQDGVHQFVETDMSLANLLLLEQVSPRMTPLEFARRASASFCTWPSALLAAQLNRKQLASSVVRYLFDGNPSGWGAYVAERRIEVPWFGEGVMEPQSVSDALVSPLETKTFRVKMAPYAANRKAGGQESSGEGIYPTWPWKPKS